MTTQLLSHSGLCPDICRTARLDRDAAYDGLFFSASATSRVYCRSICPGKPPAARNNRFFPTAAAAEAAGCRPCLRCRPELAPGHLIRHAQNWRVRHVLAGLQEGRPTEKVLAAAGKRTGMSAQALHRAVEDCIGAPPAALSRTVRLGFAKQLWSDTPFKLSTIARATGYGNTGRLQKDLGDLYGRDPLTLRRPSAPSAHGGRYACTLNLPYRPPLQWSALLDYFGKRAIANVEQVHARTYRRSFQLTGARGWWAAREQPGAHALHLEIHASNPSCLMPLVARVRRMFDLDADPARIADFFKEDPLVGPTSRQLIGLRVPSGWDSFEFAVRAVTGQVVSVAAATGLMDRIVAQVVHQRVAHAPDGVHRLFPGPRTLARTDLRPCGLTRTKAAAISALARASLAGRLDLSGGVSPETFLKQCTAIRGIGPWTAQTIAMRGLADPNAFPAGDLGIVKALSRATSQPPKPAAVEALSLRWQPLRAYAAMLLWMMNT